MSVRNSLNLRRWKLNCFN